MKKVYLLFFSMLALFILGCNDSIIKDYNLLFVDDNKGKIYLLKSNFKKPEELLPAFAKTWDPKVSPDGKTVAFTAFDSSGIPQLYIMRYHIEKTECITKFNEPFYATHGYLYPIYSWSGDSKKLVYNCPSGLGLYIYYIDSAKTVFIPSTKECSLYPSLPVWSPTNDKIAIAKLFDLFIFDVNANKWLNVTNRNLEMFNEVSWSPDGNNILYTQNDTTFIRDMRTNIDKPLPVFNEQVILEAKWSKDGSKIFYIYYLPLENISNLYFLDLANLNKYSLQITKI